MNVIEYFSEKTEECKILNHSYNNHVGSEKALHCTAHVCETVTFM